MKVKEKNIFENFLILTGNITFFRLYKHGLSIATGIFKLHRLLCFIRAVLFTPSDGCRIIAFGGEVSVASSIQPPELNPVRMITFVCENQINLGLRLPVPLIAVIRKNNKQFGKSVANNG